MHPVKPHCLFAFALAIAAIVPRPASAILVAQAPSQSWTTRANLIESRLTVQVGPEWFDVEEEAEIQAIPSSTSSKEALIVTGTFTLPQGAAITGCMLWNGDTLLMGKLRGKVQANKIFDSLVPPVTALRPVDPLLVEHVSETVYNLKLYPFEPNGTRRFRIRYLVPRALGSEAVLLRPAMSAVNGTVPSQFRLRLRGTATEMRLEVSGRIWPLDLPSNELVATATGAKILWPSAAKGCVRGRIDSGAWKGDYAMYSGELPDSVVKATSIRSETVVLWNWIQPLSLVNSNNYGGFRYPTSLGNEAISQAQQIVQIAYRTGSMGGRMGLVADLGAGDTARVWPLADSSAQTFKSMATWLRGINYNTLEGMVPASTGSSAGASPFSAGDIAKFRQRFRHDITKVATLYSADSGVIRHLLVVTAGLSASSTEPEEVDPSLLPKNVSVASSRLISQGYTYQYVNGSYVYTYNKPLASSWPGIDLEGLAAARPGTGNLYEWNGIPLPKFRSLSTARLSMKNGSTMIRRNIVLQNMGDGRLRGGMNVHASSLEKSVLWEVFDDSGRALKSWTATPAWTEVGGDSVLPRIWGKSANPISPIFGERDLGPIFGFVDPFHSLLATPSDTVGALRQVALADSGVPFLTFADIFPRQGYGNENPTGNEGPKNTSVDGRAARGSMILSWNAGARTLHIDLNGLEARTIEIRDLRGRLLATFSMAQLAGLKSLEWKVPASLGRGLLLVSVQTNAGLSTGRVMIQ